MNPTTFFYGLLLANVRQWSLGRVSFETFEAANRQLWDAIRAAHLLGPVYALVTAQVQPERN